MLKSFAVLFIECLKTIWNFSHIVPFEGKNKWEIKELVDDKISDLTSATKQLLSILEWEDKFIGSITVANQERIIKTRAQAYDEFVASLKLDQYFHYLKQSIELDYDEQQELNTATKVFISSYNRDFVQSKDKLENPDEVIQHFCENINSQNNLHYGIWIIIKLIKFSSIENKYNLVETLFSADITSENRLDYDLQLTNFRLYLQEHETDLNNQIKKLNHYSYNDTLTWLHNRRSHDENVEKAIAHVKRYEEKIGYAMIDIDRFKSFNDTYGHDVWDIVLQKVAQILKAVMRESDMAFRLGWEEFVVIGKCDEVSLSVLCEKINQAFRDNPVSHKEIIHKIRVSIWGTMIDENDTIETLNKRADIGLYAAKNSGRDTFSIQKKND